MSRYLQRKFEKAFARGCEFWTGEDGMLMSFVIARRPDWLEVLQFEHGATETIDPSRCVERYVDWVRKDADLDFPGVRKLWMLTDRRTKFPVIEYPLKVPR